VGCSPTPRQAVDDLERSCVKSEIEARVLAVGVRHEPAERQRAAGHDGDCPARAQRLYREAAERDPFSPEPAERLSELAFQQWLARPTASETDFHRAEELQQAAIALDNANDSWKKVNEDETRRQKEAGIQTITFDPATTKQYHDRAYEVGWASAIKASPTYGPQMRKLFSK
jgi:hypothetical protein